jgi:hypothetical protein
MGAVVSIASLAPARGSLPVSVLGGLTLHLELADERGRLLRRRRSDDGLGSHGDGSGDEVEGGWESS